MAAPAAADSPGVLHRVGPDVIQVHAPPKEDRPSLEAAFALIKDHRGDFGYPWMDQGSRTLRLRPVTPAGRKAAQRFRATAPLPVELDASTVSVAQLDTLMDAVVGLSQTGFPDANQIWMAEPDELNNRIIVTVGQAIPSLMSALAARFGTDRLAIRVQPAPQVGSVNRDSDSPPFWGGAAITVPVGACTTGFAWNASGQNGMLATRSTRTSGMPGTGCPGL